jgi:hypothetical protein
MHELVKFITIVKDKDGGWRPLGLQSFRLAPEIGHYITVNEGGVGQAYEVIAIMHPMEPAETAGDLILKHAGTDIEVRKSLKA